MDSLQDILSSYGQPEQLELTAVKQYVETHYRTAVSAALHGEAIVITVPSAALANTLRLQSRRLQAACNTQKRLIFRIG